MEKRSLSVRCMFVRILITRNDDELLFVPLVRRGRLSMRAGIHFCKLDGDDGARCQFK